MSEEEHHRVSGREQMRTGILITKSALGVLLALKLWMSFRHLK